MKKLGVIVARFQVAQLTRGHRDLIEFVQGKADEVLVVLGVGESFPAARNPLSFDLRKTMVNREYPMVNVAKLGDHPSDEVWSEALDNLIEGMYPNCKVTLYGSRDSFKGVYSGKFPTELFPMKTSCSGTEQRNGAKVRVGRGFLDGIIYREVNREPLTYMTVDTAVLHTTEPKVLLAEKAVAPGKYWFIGGFLDPTDETLERAAKREVIEETSFIEVDDFQYIGSAKMDDWRYRGTEDSIMTSFFMAKYIFGCPQPADDIINLEWVPLEELSNVLAEEHKVLGEMLLSALK